MKNRWNQEFIHAESKLNLELLVKKQNCSWTIAWVCLLNHNWKKKKKKKKMYSGTVLPFFSSCPSSLICWRVCATSTPVQTGLQLLYKSSMPFSRPRELERSCGTVKGMRAREGRKKGPNHFLKEGLSIVIESFLVFKIAFSNTDQLMNFCEH